LEVKISLGAGFKESANPNMLCLLLSCRFMGAEHGMSQHFPCQEWQLIFMAFLIQ
jgi:hypothetical protein